MPSAAAMIRIQARDREPPPITSAEPMRVPDARQRVETVAQRERHAFQHRLGELRASGVVGQARERAPERGVIVRRALAAEIGPEQRGARLPRFAHLGQ